MKIINFKILINNLHATKKTLIKNKTFKYKIYQDINYCSLENIQLNWKPVPDRYPMSFKVK